MYFVVLLAACVSLFISSHLDLIALVPLVMHVYNWSLKRSVSKVSAPASASTPESRQSGIWLCERKRGSEVGKSAVRGKKREGKERRRAEGKGVMKEGRGEGW